MNKQQIVATLINDFELQSLELIEDRMGDTEYKRGIVQTLRASNQTEIRTLFTKFKRLFHELIEQALQFITEEANNFFQKEHSQLFRLYAEIENLKKQMHEKENKITDLVIDNFRLQQIILTLPSQDIFDELITKYNKDLMIMQQQIVDKNNIIVELELFQQEVKKQVLDLEQQILALKSQPINPAIAMPEKPQQSSFQHQLTLNQTPQADYLYENIKQSTIYNKSETLNNSTEINSASNHYISIRSKSICTTTKEELGQENNIKKSKNVSKLPEMRGKTHYVKSNNRNSSLCTQMIDLKSLLASFENKNPKQMDSIYLFSRAKRRSLHCNADIYYEPPLYRFNLNTISSNLYK